MPGPPGPGYPFLPSARPTKPTGWRHERVEGRADLHSPEPAQGQRAHGQSRGAGERLPCAGGHQDCDRVEVYVDLDKSGKSTAKRPDFKRFLDRIVTDPPAVIALYDQSRSFRTTTEALDFYALMERMPQVSERRRPELALMRNCGMPSAQMEPAGQRAPTGGPRHGPAGGGDCGAGAGPHGGRDGRLIGVGASGSIVADQLAHMGVGHLILCETNPVRPRAVSSLSGQAGPDPHDSGGTPARGWNHRAGGHL